MSFTSYNFLLFFLPITSALYWFFNGLNLYKISKIWLIVSSLFFYYLFNKEVFYFAFFLFTIVFNFVVGQLLYNLRDNKNLKKLVLFFGLVINIGSLFYFKYTNFFINLINRFLNKQIVFIDILLPLGISFFTFRVIAYIIDCYNNKSEKYSFIDFMLYATFFPIVTMGPIERHDDFLKQVKKEGFFDFNSENFKKALFFLSIGLGKKVLIASPLMKYASLFFGETITKSPLETFLLLFANLFSFYFDFSGYSDMATGISYLFNIEIKDNFNSPYKARNIQDYWKRWHISLTKFLNTYLFAYIYKPGNNLLIFCFATMITFLVSGFWHGAGTNYILWGIMHGICMCIIAFCAIFSNKKYLLPKFLSRILTMSFLFVAAILYLADGFKNFIFAIKSLVNFKFYINPTKGIINSFFMNILSDIIFVIQNNINIVLLLIISIIISFYCKNTRQLSKDINKNNWLIVYSAIIFVISLFLLSQTSNFIYQNF